MEVREGCAMSILKGKVALITGASRGIGEAIAYKFVQNGASVALTGRKAAPLKKVKDTIINNNGSAELFPFDVSQVEKLDSLFQQVIETFGRLDILVNNAGIYSDTPIEDISPEEWDKVLEINLKATFFCTQKALPYLRNSKGTDNPKIINMGSLAGDIGGILAGANYGASKAGIVCLTKSFAKYLAPEDINVNAVSPGIIDTDMTENYTEDIISRIPFKRKGTPEEVADTALYLASKMSDYITGLTIPVNGGSFMK